MTSTRGHAVDPGASVGSVPAPFQGNNTNWKDERWKPKPLDPAIHRIDEALAAARRIFDLLHDGLDFDMPSKLLKQALQGFNFPLQMPDLGQLAQKFRQGSQHGSRAALLSRPNSLCF